MVTVQTRARINDLINGGRLRFYCSKFCFCLLHLLCRRSHLHPHVQTMQEVESRSSRQNKTFMKEGGCCSRQGTTNKPAGTICSSDPGNDPAPREDGEHRAPPPGPGIPGRGRESVAARSGGGCLFPHPSIYSLRGRGLHRPASQSAHHRLREERTTGQVE